jgi:nucleoside-diphosphate-sugar epimerase
VWFLAWDTGGAKYIASRAHEHEIYRNNALLSARVFDHLAATGRPFLFTSSQLAGLPHAYGITKLLGEQWARQLGGKVARLWNTYGWEPPDVRSHVVPDLVLAALRDRQITLRTNGLERRRLLYKTDCAAALIALFESPRSSADVAGPRWLTVREVGEHIARLTDARLVVGDASGEEVLTDPQDPPPGWEPTVSLEQGIAEVIQEARAFSAEKASPSPGR